VADKKAFKLIEILALGKRLVLSAFWRVYIFALHPV
jgi:hypothetical protein